LGYPGGPAIDRLAKTGANSNIIFPRADLPNSFDFSFSGVKTAVLYYTQKQKNKGCLPLNRIAYAFQDSVVSILVQKSITACRKKRVKTLLVGGGVAANSALRENLCAAARQKGIEAFFPPLALCLDNAAMIAGLAYRQLKNKSYVKN